MRFTLWSPRNRNAIVRIYVSGFEDAYIWRKNRTSPLEIKGTGEYGKQTIIELLRIYGIELKSLKTRRELAYVLFEQGLLDGNYMDLYPTFCDAKPKNYSSIKADAEDNFAFKSRRTATKSKTSDTSNVISMADFRKRNK